MKKSFTATSTVATTFTLADLVGEAIISNLSEDLRVQEEKEEKERAARKRANLRAQEANSRCNKRLRRLAARDSVGRQAEQDTRVQRAETRQVEQAERVARQAEEARLDQLRQELADAKSRGWEAAAALIKERGWVLIREEGRYASATHVTVREGISGEDLSGKVSSLTHVGLCRPAYSTYGEEAARLCGAYLGTLDIRTIHIWRDEAQSVSDGLYALSHRASGYGGWQDSIRTDGELVELPRFYHYRSFGNHGAAPHYEETTFYVVTGSSFVDLTRLEGNWGSDQPLHTRVDTRSWAA